jgi:excisionase family DNA binding protein
MPRNAKNGLGGEGRLMTVRESATLPAMPVATLYARVFHRQIPFVKLGRSVRFDRADLEALIEQSKVYPNEEGR